MLKSEIFDIFSILKMETIVSEKLPGIFPRIKMDGMEFPSFDQFWHDRFMKNTLFFGMIGKIRHFSMRKKQIWKKIFFQHFY